MNLNQGQAAAADAVSRFLMSDDKEFIISGPAGTGKTFLMKHIMKTLLPEYKDACTLLDVPAIDYEIQLTATTNKATEVLSEATGFPASTIHSFMNLKVQDDYKTGTTKIEPTKGWMVHNKTLLFIDEASMIDRKLLEYIYKGTDKTCKIIYVGDHCQMAPVFEMISPIYQNPKNFAVLTEPMRNAGQPALVALCQQFRDTVETGVFQPIQEVPGVVDYLDGDQALAFMNQTFLPEEHGSRVLAYTNARVQEYNGYVRHLRGYPETFTKGEILINNTGMTIGKAVLRVEQELRVEWISAVPTADEIEPGVEMDVYPMTIQPVGSSIQYEVKVPADPQHYKALMAYYRGRKDWTKFFKLKNGYPDLRQKDAATVYKAQGSTYESVLIDLKDIGKCKQPEQAARMLYVAVSRAKEHVYLYGDLPPRFKGAA